MRLTYRLGWAEPNIPPNVTARTPPTFLFHTADDTSVPVENSLVFAQALRTAGFDGRLALGLEAAHEHPRILHVHGDATGAALYARTDDNRFVEVTYASGDREVLYVADFVSGAMLANIVGRAKKSAIKEILDGGERGVRLGHLQDACRAEVRENEELPNTTNPDDWARVSGRRGERIVFLRTLNNARALDG